MHRRGRHARAAARSTRRTPKSTRVFPRGRHGRRDVRDAAGRRVGTGPRRRPLGRPAAGKTGTTAASTRRRRRGSSASRRSWSPPSACTRARAGRRPRRRRRAVHLLRRRLPDRDLDRLHDGRARGSAGRGRSRRAADVGYDAEPEADLATVADDHEQADADRDADAADLVTPTPSEPSPRRPPSATSRSVLGRRDRGPRPP